MNVGPTKNWIALEDSLQRSNEPNSITALIASSALRGPPVNVEERNVFAIYVSYYVKVKLTLSGMGGELSLKLPFTLAHIDKPAQPTIGGLGVSPNGILDNLLLLESNSSSGKLKAANKIDEERIDKIEKLTDEFDKRMRMNASQTSSTTTVVGTVVGSNRISLFKTNSTTSHSLRIGSTDEEEKDDIIAVDDLLSQTSDVSIITNNKGNTSGLVDGSGGNGGDGCGVGTTCEVEVHAQSTVL